MLALALLASAPACVIPLGAPPIRAEVGRGWNRDGAMDRMAIGAHLGSMMPAKELPIEAGLGMTVEKSTAEMSTRALGAYVDLGAVLRKTDHTRFIAGARYEHSESGVTSDTAKLRVDLELLGHVETSSSDLGECGGSTGGVRGNFGAGLYAEAGHQWFGDRSDGWAATVGITVRLPAVGVFGWANPMCGDRSPSQGHSEHQGHGSHPFGSFSGD
jgi:hypothetical protein